MPALLVLVLSYALTLFAFGYFTILVLRKLTEIRRQRYLQNNAPAHCRLLVGFFHPYWWVVAP